MAALNRFLPLAFVIVGTLILVSLGTWQMQRLAWKNDLIAHRDAGLSAPATDLPLRFEDAEAFDFRHVALEGRFRHELAQRFGVEARNGVIGYHLLTPLVRETGPMVLINRGWMPSNRDAPTSGNEGESDSLERVNGIARYRLEDRPGWFTPANDPAKGHWYHYDLNSLETMLGVELAPLVIDADAASNPGGLPMGGVTSSRLVNNHLQYAVTWYGLAVTLIGVYIVFRRQQT